MKNIFILLLITLISQATSAQDSTRFYSQTRYEITNTGMKVLGSWALTNLAVGGVGWANTTGSPKYFYQMTTFWGAANLGAAILGYTTNKKSGDGSSNAAESLKAQQRIERTFLINGGLDVAYVGTGIYLNQRGNNQLSDKLNGYGKAVMLQGAFLLLFDGTMYASHRHYGNRFRRFLQNNPVIFDGRKVGMVFKL